MTSRKYSHLFLIFLNFFLKIHISSWTNSDFLTNLPFWKRIFAWVAWPECAKGATDKVKRHEGLQLEVTQSSCFLILQQCMNVWMTFCTPMQLYWKAESNKNLPLFVFQLCTQKFLQFYEPSIQLFICQQTSARSINCFFFHPAQCHQLNLGTWPRSTSLSCSHPAEDLS